ncbi:hypothetical protein ACFQ7O_23935 [Streptomyces sp. NPDC056485]|uniref:hypothetical protein n=1 Tax=Streptomyces sp. NPDC056485 TaxID=3345834 RepID=UPI00367DDBAD
MSARDALLRVLRRAVSGEEAEQLLAARDEERIGEAADWLHSRGLRPAAYLLNTSEIPVVPEDGDARQDDAVDVAAVRYEAVASGYRVRWTTSGRRRVKTFPDRAQAREFVLYLEAAARGGGRW